MMVAEDAKGTQVVAVRATEGAPAARGAENPPPPSPWLNVAGKWTRHRPIPSLARVFGVRRRPQDRHGGH